MLNRAVLSLLAIAAIACGNAVSSGGGSSGPHDTGTSDIVVALAGDSVADAAAAADLVPSADVPTVADAASIPDAPARAPANSWTILVYMVADNDLEPAALSDLKEMMEVGSAVGFQILVQIDRAVGYSEAPIGGLPNFTTCKRLRVEQGKLNELQDLGEMDRTKPTTLADFIQWGIATAPADRIAFVYWDHGAGVWGAGLDESVGPHALASLQQIRDGIGQGLKAVGIARFDVIGFDACLMATWEVASTLRPYGRYLVASQETEPGHGWDYRRLKLIRDTPSLDPTALGKIIADGFLDQGKAEKQAERITLSVVDLDKVPAIDSAMAKLADLLEKPGDSLTVPLARALRGTLRFGDSFDPAQATHHVDLGLTAQLGIANVSPKSAAVAAELQSALAAAVIYKVAGPATSDARGLSVFLPFNAKYFHEQYDAIAASGAWSSGLKAFFASEKALGASAKQSGPVTLQWKGADIVVASQLTVAAVTAWVDIYALLGVQNADGSVDTFLQAPAEVAGLSITTKAKAQYLALQGKSGKPAPLSVSIRKYQTASGPRVELRILLRIADPGFDPNNVCILRLIYDGNKALVSTSLVILANGALHELSADQMNSKPLPVVPLMKRWTKGVPSFVPTTDTPIDFGTSSIISASLSPGLKMAAGVLVEAPDGSIDLKWSTAEAVAALCGDGLCAAGETAASCPADCTPKPTCGDGQCQAGETPLTCVVDCKPVGPVCGDSKCEPPETAQVCPFDCGAANSSCGDGACDSDETATSCPADCKPKSVCGDGVCTADESAATCAGDCGNPAACGDYVCSVGETIASCSFDCDPADQCIFGKCLNEVKGCLENVGCAKLNDCVVACGADKNCAEGCNLAAAPGSKPLIQALQACIAASGCIPNSGPTCGDGKCDGGETDVTCPGDCPVVSGTCQGFCGKQSPAGCWCDDKCTQSGDCCADIDSFCGAGCSGKCGQASKDSKGNACYCDDKCTGNGDCCDDFEQMCP